MHWAIKNEKDFSRWRSVRAMEGGSGKEALEQKLDEAVAEGIPKSGTQEGKWRG